jgi:hypothetical protein
MPVRMSPLTDVDDVEAERSSCLWELRLRRGHWDHKRRASPARWMKMNSSVEGYEVGSMNPCGGQQRTWGAMTRLILRTRWTTCKRLRAVAAWRQTMVKAKMVAWIEFELVTNTRAGAKFALICNASGKIHSQDGWIRGGGRRTPTTVDEWGAIRLD